MTTSARARPPRAAAFPGLPGGARGLGREVATFAAIGVASTLAYGVLYVAFRGLTGPVVANTLALLLTALGNTAANRRLTFGVRGTRSMVRDLLVGLAALGVALAITTGAVTLLGLLAPAPGHVMELVVLTAANVAATASRFVLLRVFVGRRAPQPATAAAGHPARSVR